MAIFDRFKSLLSKDVSGFNGGDNNVQVDTSKLPVFPRWFFTAHIGQPRNVDIFTIREFAKSTWVQMVLNTIKKEISTIKYEIVNVDEDDKNNYDKQKKQVKEFLCNINQDNWDVLDLASCAVTDIGEIDANVWVKVFSKGSYVRKTVPIIGELGEEKGTEKRLVLKPFGKRQLLGVRQADGSTFLKQIDVYRRLQNYYQYSFKNPRSNPIRFEVDEVIYMMMNKRSYELYGYSPVQAITQVLELLIKSTKWNKDYYKNNAIPDGIISLIGANPDSMKKFKTSWMKEVKGKAHKLVFHNTDMKFERFANSSKDMEFLEGQKWYSHLVFGIFGVSPVEAGFHENVNQGNQAGQERVTVKNAIKPYLKILERGINNIIRELLQDDNPKIKFVFKPKDHAQEQIEFAQNMQELTNATLTINEYRASHGRKEVEWGDVPMSMQFMINNDKESNSESSSENNSDDGDKDSKDDKDDKEDKPSMDNSKDDLDSKKKEYIIKEDNNDVDPGEEMVEESKSYADFYKNVVKGWEKKAIQAVNSIDTNKSFDINNKTFGEFLSKLFNSINTKPFINALRKFIKADLTTGLENAENDIGVDVGFTEAFSQRLDILENQQLNGYTINGKKWYGIKGATNELQTKIYSSVSEDIVNKVSKKEMVNNIKEIFSGSTTSQAERIARTETTRFINEGKLMGYKESGLALNKSWNAVEDNNTSEICNRLHELYFEKGIPLDSKFRDPVTGKEYDAPPAHPNCFIKGELVKTKNGYKPIESLKKGDSVLTHKNRYRNIITLFDNKYTGNIYTIKTNKGTFKCTSNHPILTNYGWKEAQDITINDHILCIKNGNNL